MNNFDFIFIFSCLNTVFVEFMFYYVCTRFIFYFLNLVFIIFIRLNTEQIIL